MTRDCAGAGGGGCESGEEGKGEKGPKGGHPSAAETHAVTVALPLRVLVPRAGPECHCHSTTRVGLSLYPVLSSHFTTVPSLALCWSSSLASALVELLLCLLANLSLLNGAVSCPVPRGGEV